MFNKIPKLDGLKKSRYNASLKYEPFILHVQCRDIKDGQLMVTLITYFNYNH